MLEVPHAGEDYGGWLRSRIETCVAPNVATRINRGRIKTFADNYAQMVHRIDRENLHVHKFISELGLVEVIPLPARLPEL